MEYFVFWGVSVLFAINSFFGTFLFGHILFMDPEKEKKVEKEK